MIELYSGTPGSGKSIHLARTIKERLQSKKSVVIGNFFFDAKLIPKRKGYYLNVENYQLTPERLLEFSRRYSKHIGRRLHEGELLLIFDEAQLLFNAREWQSAGRKGWLSFFTQHRHYGFDIIMAAQFDRMLDRNVRCLIENEYIHRKVSRAGNIGAIVGLFTGGNLFIWIKKWYPLKEKLDSKFFMGGKKIYALYDSYNHFEDVEKAKAAALEREKIKRANKYKVVPVAALPEDDADQEEKLDNIIRDEEIIKAVPDEKPKKKFKGIFGKKVAVNQ